MYSITKDVAVNSRNVIVINSNKEKIKKLVIEIGERIYKNNIEVNDKNVKAEVECIKELMMKGLNSFINAYAKENWLPYGNEGKPRTIELKHLISKECFLF